MVLNENLLTYRGQFKRRFLQFIKHGECFFVREMCMQQFHDLIIIRSHRPKLCVESGQFRHVFERPAVGFYHAECLTEHPGLDECGLRQYARLFPKGQKAGIFFGGEIDRTTINGRVRLRGTAAFPLFHFFHVLHIHYGRRPIGFLIPRPCRLYPGADFGGACPPPCGQAVFCCKTRIVQQKTQLAVSFR